MSVTIREAVGDDQASIEALWVAAWTAAMPEIDFGDRLGWFHRHLIALRETGASVLVACDGSGTVLGFITVDLHTGELDQLAVAETAQRRGIGLHLIDEAKRHSPAGLALAVNTGNAPAIALYRRAGFRMTGEGHNARSGLPVWHMRWTP